MDFGAVDFIGKFPASGSVLNALAIFAGGALGFALRKRLKERYIDAVLKSIAFSVILLGIIMGQRTHNFLILVVSLVLGTLIGEFIDLEGYLEKLGGKQDNTNKNIQGFVSASVLFCAGSMAILGGIEDGSGSYPAILATKSVMDFCGSVAFGASLGFGVMFSAIPVLIYQGAITFLASTAQNFLTPMVIDEIGAVGGILLMGIGISILELKRIKTCNILPAIVIAAVIAGLM